MATTAKQKRKRPNEKNLPNLAIPESILYQKLQATEKQLDTVLIRKRLDIQEAVSRPMKTKKYLRVFVSNSAAYQDEIMMPVNDLEDAVPSWTLNIQGKVLESSSGFNGGGSVNRKFTSFFKKIVIELQRDPEIYPEGNIIEWHKGPNVPETDGFELKRGGDQNIDCKIMFYLDSMPEKFKLSTELSSVLNLHTESKPSVILTLWQYIKAHKLQDQHDHRIINCDDALKSIFQVPHFQFTQLSELILPHMAPADPIVFDYVIQVDKSYSASQYYLDIEVETDDPSRSQLLRFLTNTTTAREIANLDQQNVAAVHLHKLKRNFMHSFATDPVGFINKWIASQSRDEELIVGDQGVNKEWQRRADFYRESWVAEAVLSYLAQYQQFE